jgi:hypothetical protein
MSDVILSAAYGGTSGMVGALLARLLDQQPAVVWCEPTPTRCRIQGFQTLWLAPCNGLRRFSNVQIAEARLFWATGAMHLCATAEAVRWAAFWEGEHPDWLSPVGEVKVERLVGFHRVERQVLTLRDSHRYGLGSESGSEWPGELKVVEYRQGTRLVFWRMEEAKG